MTHRPASPLSALALPPRILIVDDDTVFSALIAVLLEVEGYDVVAVTSGTAALAALALARERGIPFDAILLDLCLPAFDGLEVVAELRRLGEGVPVVMMSGMGTVESAVRALHLGADDFLLKPFPSGVIVARLAEALARRPVSDPRDSQNPGGMIGRAPAMLDLFASLRRAASTAIPVFIRGEPGTGTACVARALHDLSPRSAGPFCAVSCAARSPATLEAALFGRAPVAGASSRRSRPGIFETANHGTVFLDDVGAVPMELQQRLLQLLHHGKLALGGTARSRQVDVRIVAASTVDLPALVDRGEFREDLRVALAAFTLDLPPLRERPGDLPLLVQHALGNIHRSQAVSPRRGCSPFAMRLLQRYPWPGNVRELFAVIEAAAVHAGPGRIEVQHLPARIRDASTRAASAPLHLGEPNRYRGTPESAAERAQIVAALAATNGVRARAADLLGMGRTTLWRKLKAYGLDP